MAAAIYGNLGRVTTTTDSSAVTHTYLNAGTYHVNLTANNASGTDTTGATISF